MPVSHSCLLLPATALLLGAVICFSIYGGRDIDFSDRNLLAQARAARHGTQGVAAAGARPGDAAAVADAAFSVEQGAQPGVAAVADDGAAAGQAVAEDGAAAGEAGAEAGAVDAEGGSACCAPKQDRLWVDVWDELELDELGRPYLREGKVGT